ncbi:ATP-binding protein [Candidatus Bathyarchaeota archaeon RBG_13_52_12]|nr:MAG: ATP-binding protein [Candidatus Bathyarchaeota archaeon RBG_13_52_12]
MSDPRLAIIPGRFDNVKRIIAVSSGKGGVGKSMVAVALALSLRARSNKVGLLDLDFTSPSTHVILGAEGLYPEEEKGITPPVTQGLSYMSIVHYSEDEPVPLRGLDASNAIIELLAITRWEELDYLIIDMPPGIGDATLDMLRLIPRIEFLVVTTPSQLAYESVRKLLVLLQDQKIPIIGVVENMVIKQTDHIKEEIHKIGSRYLGAIDHDASVEAAIGHPEKLEMTRFYRQVEEIGEGI